MASKRLKLPFENTYEFLGAKMNYRVIGSGEPVILLHGSMIYDPWDGFELQLANHYKVYLPELPGFGASEAVEGRIHNTELFAQALSEFVKVTHLESAPVIAFSLGTVVAVRAAAAKSLKGILVLVGMPIRLESKTLEQIIGLPITARHVLAANEVARGGILLSILKDVIGMADSSFVLKYLKILRTTDVRAMVDTNLVEEVEKDLPWLFSQVKNPMWVIYGSKDRLIMGAQKWLNRKILEIPEAGHDIFISKPEETLLMINRILKPWGALFRIWKQLIP